MAGENERDALDFMDGPNDVVVEQLVKTDTAIVDPAKPVVAAVVDPTKPVVAAVDPAKPATGTVAAEPAAQPTLTEFLTNREELATAKARLKELEVDDEIQIPDPKTDPDGYRRFEQVQTQMFIVNERMNFSEKFAVREFGKEKVAAAKEWAMGLMESDPTFQERIFSDPDPYSTVVEEHARFLMTKDMTPERYSKFIEWEKSQAGGSPPANGAKPAQADPANGSGSPAAKPAAAQPAAASPKPAAEKIPRSIADEASAGGTHTVPNGPGQAFDSAFPQ